MTLKGSLRRLRKWISGPVRFEQARRMWVLNQIQADMDAQFQRQFPESALIFAPHAQRDADKYLRLIQKVMK